MLHARSHQASQVALHFVGLRCVSVTARHSWELQPGGGKCSGCRARQQGTPAQPPCLLGPPSEQLALTPHFSVRQQAQEGLGGRPPAAHFHAQDNKSRPCSGPNQLWVPPSLPVCCHCQRDTILVSCSASGRPVAVQRADHCGVHGKLRPAKQWQTVDTLPVSLRRRLLGLSSQGRGRTRPSSHDRRPRGICVRRCSPPFSQAPPLVRTLLGGGHGCQVDGHTGRYAQLGAEAIGGAATEGHGTGGDQSS